MINSKLEKLLEYEKQFTIYNPRLPLPTINEYESLKSEIQEYERIVERLKMNKKNIEWLLREYSDNHEELNRVNDLLQLILTGDK